MRPNTLIESLATMPPGPIPILNPGKQLRSARPALDRDCAYSLERFVLPIRQSPL